MSYPVKPKDEMVVIKYLRDHANKGQMYFKARYISQEIGFSPSKVGVIIGLLRDKEVPGLKIVAWSGTKATTWRVDKV